VLTPADAGPAAAPAVVEGLELEDSAECAGESTRTTFRRATRALTLGHDDFASVHDRNRPVLSTISQLRRATMTGITSWRMIGVRDDGALR
jgi:hypothetical protein